MRLSLEEALAGLGVLTVQEAIDALAMHDNPREWLSMAGYVNFSPSGTGLERAYTCPVAQYLHYSTGTPQWCTQEEIEGFEEGIITLPLKISDAIKSNDAEIGEDE